MTHTQIMAAAMQLDAVADIPMQSIATWVRCAISGELIDQGYQAMKIAPAALNDFLGTFNGDPHGWLSDSAARCLKSDWNLGSRICFADGTHLHLLASRDQAEKQDRPYWSKVIRELAADPSRRDTECVIILAADVKKRVWHRARAGRFGRATPVMVHVPEWNVSENRALDIDRLIAVLNGIEAIYSQGFTRNAIRLHLLSEWKAVQRVGFAEAQRLERWCVEHRDLPEFIPALAMAQKAPALIGTTKDTAAQNLAQRDGRRQK